MNNAILGGVIPSLKFKNKTITTDINVKIKLTDQAKDYLIDNGYDQVYGARPLKRFVKKKLETLIAEKILNQEILPMSKILIDCKENKLIVA